MRSRKNGLLRGGIGSAREMSGIVACLTPAREGLWLARMPVAIQHHHHHHALCVAG